MFQKSRSTEEESTQEQLRIYTLGRFQVRFGGQTLFAESRGSQKTGQLFMYLITQRDKLAAPEAILEALWPDQEYSNPKNAVKIMVHRLRKKLVEQGVPQAKSVFSCKYGFYGFNHDSAHWLDAEAFENLCQKAHDLTEGDPLRAAELYRQALALYRGDYLPECLYCDWVLPLRHYYRRLFVRSVSELLAIQKKHQLYSQLLKDCEKALYIDPFDEDLHLRYIEALLEEGKTNRARAHYTHITALLYHELGAKPSPEMRRIYRTILKKQNEHPGLNFSDFQQKLQERDETWGPLICEPDEFVLFCRLEKRKAERNGTPVHLGFLTLTGPDFQPPASAQLQVSMEQLNQVLLSGLRRGDVITPWNESQFMLLLPGLSLDQAEKVLQRVNAMFTTPLPRTDVNLRCSVHPILPLIDL